MPAETFVQIWKCISRPNICETPAFIKPPPRCVQADESAVERVAKLYRKESVAENAKGNE